MGIKSSFIYQKAAYLKECVLDYLNFIIIKLCHKEYIVVNCWAIQRWGKIVPHNFGDDINIPLIEALTSKKVLLYSTLPNKNVPNLMCIGSVIETHLNINSIIWGSGILYGGNNMIDFLPSKISAVRGPLTREVLINNGVDCPPVYGDPALLLPLIYEPCINKKYKFGIIPHYTDLDSRVIKHALIERDDVLVIDLVNYKSWDQIVDEILSCEYILSSSLHGIIISDAYGIPNIHIGVSDNVNGGEFKFRDYSLGVDKEYLGQIDFKDGISFDLALEKLNKYKKISFDKKALLKAFPFELNQRFSAFLEN